MSEAYQSSPRPAGPGLDERSSFCSPILYSDADWLIVNKPYGLPTHGGDPGDVGVQEWLKLHMGIETFVCSRLDKGTTGVLLFAKSAEGSAAAERIHTQELARKVYYFLSDRDLRVQWPSGWTCREPLDGKSAQTDFCFDGEVGPRLFRYRAEISRGRMHQIRRHAAMSGCPLWGDQDYGGSQAPRLALHCAELQWPGLPQIIRAPLPDSFRSSGHGHGKTQTEALAALEKRGHWMAAISSAWRVIQRGELSSCDLSMDIYGAHALVWVYDDAVFEKLQEVLSPLIEILERQFAVAGVVFRWVGKNPHKKGLVQNVRMIGAEPPASFAVYEHDWQALVSLTERQHVGLFLDHRDNRRRVQNLARGKRIANLFSYTCAFAIAAAKADCEVVVNVDAAASALTLGKKNFELNHLSDLRRGKFVERDVRLWIKKQLEKMEAGQDAGWDIIICDPPTFSVTREGGHFHVSHEWFDLAES